MKAGTLVAAALLVFAASAGAQAPCSTTRAVVDSARDDLLSVLNSGRPLVVELRQEQGMSKPEALSPVTVVNDRYVCAKMAGLFEHMVPPGTKFAVLRIGPVYYARDPDQRRGTGVIADTTFKVLMKLGVAVETK